MEKAADEGPILALDVGKRRIGLAISDPLRVIALGLETFQRTRVREDVNALTALIRERNVGVLLVGKPLHMGGQESRQSEYTREFAERLTAAAGVPLVYWDERLTSVEAGRTLRAAGASLAQQKLSIDRLSAVLILESYLGFLQNQTKSSEVPD